MNPIIYRKYLPLFLTAITAIIIIVSYYINPRIVPQVRDASNSLLELSTIITLIAIFFAIVSLSRTSIIQGQHAKTTFDKFLAYEIVGVLAISLAIALGFGISSTAWTRYYEYTYAAAIIGAGFSNAYWTFFAGYKALRFRSLDSTAILVSSMIVLAGVSGWAKLWVPWLGSLGQWCLDYVNVPVSRGIVIGGGIGSAIVGVRTILGRERALLRTSD